MNSALAVVLRSNQRVWPLCECPLNWNKVISPYVKSADKLFFSLWLGCEAARLVELVIAWVESEISNSDGSLNKSSMACWGGTRKRLCCVELFQVLRFPHWNIRDTLTNGKRLGICSWWALLAKTRNQVNDMRSLEETPRHHFIQKIGFAESFHFLYPHRRQTRSKKQCTPTTKIEDRSCSVPFCWVQTGYRFRSLTSCCRQKFDTSRCVGTIDPEGEQETSRRVRQIEQTRSSDFSVTRVPSAVSAEDADRLRRFSAILQSVRSTWLTSDDLTAQGKSLLSASVF